MHGINHLGDWGSQFGKILVAFEEWGDEGKLQANPMRHLYEIYVRFKKESDKDPSLGERAAEAFRRLESGEDNAERRRWQQLRDISLEAFKGPYSRLAAEFEAYTGESFYEDKMEGTVEALKAAGIATMSEGALVVELDGMPPCILVKSDGTTIYATRDLAALFYRRETYGFDKALYVVGSEQKLHFRQLRAVIEKLGWPEASGIEHVDFGLVLSWDEEAKRWSKFSTRDGNAIFLDEVLDEAVAQIRRIIEEKNPELADKDAVAETIGVGAIVFNDLKNGRIKDVKFDWKEMLSFEGETGPYVQYAGARLASILRKAGVPRDAESGAPRLELDAIDWSTLADADVVLLTMLEFGPTLQRCIDKNEPSTLTGLMIRLASTIHSYLRDHHVLSAEAGDARRAPRARRGGPRPPAGRPRDPRTLFARRNVTMKLEDYIRDIPDFPKPGIIFKDISPLLGDANAFRLAITKLANALDGCEAKKILGDRIARLHLWRGARARARLRLRAGSQKGQAPPRHDRARLRPRVRHGHDRDPRRRGRGGRKGHRRRRPARDRRDLRRGSQARRAAPARTSRPSPC